MGTESSLLHFVLPITLIVKQAKKMDSVKDSTTKLSFGCIICLDDDDSITGHLGGRALVKASCNAIPHVFHLQCITHWLDNQPEERALDQRQCAACRQPALPLIRLVGGSVFDDESPYCESLMLNACRTGDREALKAMLAHNEGLANRTYRSALTGLPVYPLSIAIDYGHTDCARDLVNSIESIKSSLYTADQKGNIEALTAGLHAAASKGSVESLNLLINLTDINAANGEGKTPLHIAVQNGRTLFLKELMGAGANVNARDVNGNTPLLFAAQSGDLECVKALLAAPGILVNRGYGGGVTPLYCAIIGGYMESAKALLTAPGILVNEQDFLGYAPLHHAASLGHAELVKALLTTTGIVVNEQGKLGTPLHIAAMCGHAECVKALLDAPGILVNEKNQSGDTPLHSAVMCGHAECAKALLTAPGILVDETDDHNMTALLQAKLLHRTECLKLLIENGANEGGY